MTPPYYLRFTATALRMGDNVGLVYPRQEMVDSAARIFREVLKSAKIPIVQNEHYLTRVRIELPNGKQPLAHFSAYDSMRAGNRYHWYYIDDPDVDPRSLPNFFTRFAPDYKRIPRNDAEYEALVGPARFE